MSVLLTLMVVTKFVLTLVGPLSAAVTVDSLSLMMEGLV